MTTPPDRPATLRQALAAALAQGPKDAQPALQALDRRLPLRRLIGEGGLGQHLHELAGRAILLRTGSQLSAALALVELDGVARRLVLAPPDLSDDLLPGVIEAAGVEAIVSDADAPASAGARVVVMGRDLARSERSGAPEFHTEWVMFTSGTTGAPKMVVHSLAGLTGAIEAGALAEPTVWGTFYDIRRYGGLQILLRSLFGGCDLVLSDAHERVEDFLQRLGHAGVTRLSGTPSHWRRALMSPQIGCIAPRYVRLSGEIADQDILDSLAAAFPDAAIGHAYASTEAGVGFEVTDGLEGFPAEWVGRTGSPVEMRVAESSLQLRSGRAASGYVGSGALVDDDGFVDTGDLVELREGRYHFVGRRGGIINVGGLKVHPEEVEAVINASPSVRLSRVSGRKNPITGMIVVAEVVLDGEPQAVGAELEGIKSEILDRCRTRLAPFKVPAAIKVAASLPLTAGGKLARAGA